MFNDNSIFKGPKLGRIHVAIMPNKRGEGYILQFATRTQDGYTYSKPIGPILVSHKEAIHYRRKYVYGDKDVRGGFTPNPLAHYPLLAICRHARYRNNENMCIEDGCVNAAYQDPMKEF